MSDTLLVTTPMILQSNDQNQYEITFLYYSTVQTDGMPTEKTYRLYQNKDNDFDSMADQNIFPIYIPANAKFLFINTTPYQFLTGNSTTNTMTNTFSLLDDNNSNIANPIQPKQSYYPTPYYVYIQDTMSTTNLATPIQSTNANKTQLLQIELVNLYKQFKVLATATMPNQQLLTNILSKITGMYTDNQTDPPTLEQKQIATFIAIINIEIQHKSVMADVNKATMIDTDNYYTVYAKGLTNNKLAIIYLIVLCIFFAKLIILLTKYTLDEQYNRYINISLYLIIITTFVLQNYGLFYDLFH